MPSSITSFDTKDIIVIGIVVSVMSIFAITALKLAFTKKESSVSGSYDPESGAASFKSKNLAVVSLIVSALLLAFMFHSASAQHTEQWVYLGPGFDEQSWNFEKTDGTSNILIDDILKARRNVNIRNDSFGPLTGILPKSIAPEPTITGSVSAGQCVRVLGSRNVGFNKIWMNIIKINCP